MLITFPMRWFIVAYKHQLWRLLFVEFFKTGAVFIGVVSGEGFNVSKQCTEPRYKSQSRV